MSSFGVSMLYAVMVLRKCYMLVFYSYHAVY